MSRVDERCSVPLKYLAGINERSLPETKDPTFEFDYIDIGSVGHGRIVEEPETVTFENAPSRARRVVRCGDTIVSTVRTYLRAVLPIDASVDTSNTIVSTGFAVLSPHAPLDGRYFGWVAQSDPFIEEVVARSVGVSYPAINATDLGRFSVRLPPPAEQRAIANFLDAETARIDALIAEKRRLLALLNERIDAEIMEWIGRSELACSGVGDRAAPIKRLLTKLSRSVQVVDMVTAYRDGQVTARSLRRAEGYTDAWTDGANVQGVARDDVVVHGLDAFSGAVGWSEADGVCSPIYHVCLPADGGSPLFYARLLRVLAVSGYLELFATSTRERAVDLRNWDLFGRIPVPVVPPAVQHRVGERIRKLVPLKVAVDRSADLAAERRHALITAAVTGQLDVPGVAA